MMDAKPDPFADGPINYERLIEFSSCSRPVCTLVAMADKNDPFFIRPHRRRKAEWFAKLWQEHCASRPNMHTRGIHYVLISLKDRPNREGNVKPYENTEDCYNELIDASRDARLLDLVPISRIDDQRNDVPVEHLPNYADIDKPDAVLEVTDGAEPEIDVEPLDTIDEPTPSLFTGDNPIEQLEVLGLTSPPEQLDMPDEVESPEVPEMEVGFDDEESLIPQVDSFPPDMTPPWFHLELWCEKTTMNNILLEIARARRLNVITGPGFQSLTGSWKLIERAKRSGRPVRILYISDFDPSGRRMPLAVARVIEMLLRRENLDLDIKLIPVAMTHKQCVDYQLPRTPIKETVKGKNAFEERYGEGATELDALEALHPGVLSQILLREINRYSDPTFPDRMEEAHDQLKDELNRTTEGIISPYREELDELIAKPQELVDQRNAEVENYVTGQLAELNARIAEITSEPVESINDRLADVRESADEIDEEIEEMFGDRLVPLNEILREVRAEAEAINADVGRVGEEGIAEINRGIDAINARYEAEMLRVKDRVGEIQKEIRDELETAARPVLDAVEWPKPEEDASVAPLFDSKRAYLEQMDFYKRHLGKATSRKSSGDGLKRKRVLQPRGPS